MDPLAPIAILGGTGQQGRGLARRLAQAGFPIVVGSRDPARAASAIAAWSAPGITSADYGEAVASADTVMLAIPFDSVDATLAQVADRFGPQALLIDLTVPITVTAGAVTLADIPEGSAAEHVRARLPAHVRMAAAFKTVPAHLLNELDQPLDCDDFVCGDSPEARAAAIAIVQRIAGLRAIDIGPLARARSVEHLTLLAIAVNRRQKIHDARFRVVGI